MKKSSTRYLAATILALLCMDLLPGHAGFCETSSATAVQRNKQDSVKTSDGDSVNNASSSVQGNIQLASASISPIAGIQPGTTAGISVSKDPNATRKEVIRYSFLVGLPAVTYFFAIYAWNWGDRNHWLWAHEGYFGERTYQGGEDKFAHAYSHYLVMRTACNIFDYTENGSPRKWFYAGGLTLALGLSIEVGDAYSGENGFSFEDITANLAGITLGYLLEKYPKADKFVGYSATYFPSKYYRDHPGMLWKFPDDYSGLKFMLNFKLAGFEYVGFDIPDFLRYVMIDLGYYCRNYTKYDNNGLGEDKSLWKETSRYWFIGLSVNLMEVVNSCFDRKPSMWNSALQQPFKYYHVPLGYSVDTRID